MPNRRSSTPWSFTLLLSFLIIVNGFADPVWGQEEEPAVETELPTQETSGEAAFFRLEEEIVTSAAKYAQSISEAPSAIAVITKEDIRQSGTLDMTQLFRFTPGVMVVESSGTLAREVMVRGFPQRFSPRLLVLYDGTPIYTPLFSGVTWGFIPISLNSIDRIEIVRGASSTLYGANAFSGVVNIISKEIAPRQSFYAYGSGGNLQFTQEEFIWDRPLSEKMRFRLSGLFRHDNGYGANNGAGQFDGQLLGQGMFDLAVAFTDKTELKFYAYGRGARREEDLGGFLGNQRPDFFSLYTGFRFHHAFTDRHGLNAQANFHDLDQSGFTTTPSTHTRREVSGEVQYTGRFGERDTLVAGINARHGGYSFLNFLPAGLQRLRLASVYVNNDFKIRDNLILTTGGRYEFDSITEHQLSGRGNLTYQPFENHAFRVSFARAVRTPSVIEDRLNLRDVPGAAPAPLPPTTLTDALGNPNLKSEAVLAGEFGYLGNFWNNRIRTNLQFYFNHISDLITLGVSRVDLTATPPRLTVNFNNRGSGQVYGVETEVAWKVFDWWQNSINYTLTRQRQFETGRFPKNLLNFKNRFVFKNGFSTELLFNWTSPYTFFNTLTATTSQLGHIFRLDARIAQKFFKDRFEISVVGQNLIDAPHSEEDPTRRVDRLFYGMLSFTY
jgi:iron complex outermembrane receptor protein